MEQNPDALVAAAASLEAEQAGTSAASRIIAARRAMSPEPAKESGVEQQLAPREEPPTRPRQTPSVGRMVSYFAYGTPGGEYPAGVARAAVITEVDEPGDQDSPVSLAIFNPTGLFFTQHVPHRRSAGGWDWPEFVPPK